ncbi:hypothetical protein CRG98_015040 [Punica granatum]|uniref:Uncharacterized protein n=1 Tax=Punica granatum TaxID=22663 RepID=A0A2I0K7T5_PUNGR|nr:hypothetical protein CRG98_015040 [Punica granatum]
MVRFEIWYGAQVRCHPKTSKGPSSVVGWNWQLKASTTETNLGNGFGRLKTWGDEQDFQATEEYILHFYRWGPLTPEDLTEDLTDSSQPEGHAPSKTSPTAIQVEFASLRFERDHFRPEVVEQYEQLIDQRLLQKELAHAHAELQRRD